MARINKKEVKKPVKQTKESSLSGIKEESEKGELFFKIVLIVMAVALVSVVIYFVVDAILSSGRNDNPYRYETSNYITTTDVTKITNRENFENIEHEGLKNALDNFGYVYVLVYSDSGTNSWQPGVLDITDELMGLSSVKTVKVGDFEYTVLNDDYVLFFLNIDDADNEGWQAVIDTTDGQASRADFPALLEVVNGEDLNWFGPHAQAGQNKSSEAKLNDVLDQLS